MKKMLATFLIVLLLLSSLSVAFGEALSGKIVVWSSGDELTRFVEGFNQVYPNIEVEVTVIPNADFLAKLEPAIVNNQGAPDVFTGESDYVKYLVETDFWQDLREEPYGVEKYLPDIWEYVAAVGTDSQGAVKALSFQASPGSLIYRRDVAQRILGVSEPEAVEKLLTSNEAMLEVAAKMKEGGVKMFASWQDIFNMQFSNRTSPWVVEGKLMVEENMVEFFDMAKTIATQGYDLNTDPWSGEWFAAVEGDEIFCYVLPTWGYQFLVKPSAVETSGKWGLCAAPVPYVKGGTWLGISNTSSNKELAWKFLEYTTCNSEALEAYGAEYGEYVAVKSADERLAQKEGEAVLAGQNLYDFYNRQMAQIPADCMSAYDQQVNNAYLSAVKAYAYDGVSLEDALVQFKEDVLNAYPELIVE